MHAPDPDLRFLELERVPGVALGQRMKSCLFLELDQRSALRRLRTHEYFSTKIPSSSPGGCLHPVRRSNARALVLIIASTLKIHLPIARVKLTIPRLPRTLRYASHQTRPQLPARSVARFRPQCASNNFCIEATHKR